MTRPSGGGSTGQLRGNGSHAKWEHQLAAATDSRIHCKQNAALWGQIAHIAGRIADFVDDFQPTQQRERLPALEHRVKVPGL